ncbi:hypothetical protein J3459_010337 [Metarhizium acridum]|nr:hypothetical protein J3459_010337 [Metarhizium acridum]
MTQISADNNTDGPVIYSVAIASRIAAELPFMITEEIIMSAIVKQEGKPNGLVERIEANEFFEPIWGELGGMLKAELYTGRRSQIVEKCCGSGGPVEKAVAPYVDYIRGITMAKINV